jgi:predicted NAD/FAD-dependent oxidoreductase
MAKKELEWVLVETVDMFRMRYVVQVPKGKHVNALDTVVMHEAKEFSQKHLDETITSHRVISEKEALALAIEDNEYGSSWTKDKKISAFFTKEGEKADWT